MSDIFEKIESLERELQKAREEKNRIESLPPAFRLAELLHERLCHQNHTDAC